MVRVEWLGGRISSSEDIRFDPLEHLTQAPMDHDSKHLTPQAQANGALLPVPPTFRLWKQPSWLRT